MKVGVKEEKKKLVVGFMFIIRLQRAIMRNRSPIRLVIIVMRPEASEDLD